MASINISFLHLLVLATALALGECANRCMEFNITDLGRTDIVSTQGIVSQAIGFPVRINRYNVLCLSSSDFVFMYQSASVLIEYFCPNCRGIDEQRVEQFTFDCSLNVTLSEYFWDSRTVLQATPASSVTFDTLHEPCGFCEHPDRIEQELPRSVYNPDTHCLRE